MRPVLAAISAAGGIEQRLILTGQHRGLRDGFDFIAERSVRQLGINTAEQSPGEMSGAVRDMLCRVLDRRGADLVLVHGDTASAMALRLPRANAAFRSAMWKRACAASTGSIPGRRKAIAWRSTPCPICCSRRARRRWPIWPRAAGARRGSPDRQ
jgi:hypothetical protein